MTYTQVFGGTTIYPSDVSYLSLTLDADFQLEWPLENSTTNNPAARIIDVTAPSSHSILLPDATQTGAGQTLLFNNLSASASSFLLKDYAGNTLATVGVGEQWQVYLAATTTAAGTWRVFRYGASTATVQPSALAGYGLTVTSNTLSQSLPVTTFNSSPRTLLATDRASALVWTGTGNGTLNLLAAASVGNNFFFALRNSGGGDLTVDAAGTETIDGALTLVLRPGESAQLITDGLAWYTLGLGQEAVFAFDYTSISVAPGGTYTLSGSELNRIAYKFVGALSSDCYVVVPSTVQQYWVDNATTGSYGLYLQTSGGTPVGVGQGTRGIYYCNGTQVVDADTSTIALPVSAANGGTGITNYAIGDILYASGTQTLSRLADVAVGNVLLSGGVGVIPSYGKVGLATHVSGTLPVANGGSGASSLTGYVSGNGTSAFTASATIPVTDLTGTLPISKGGTGSTSTTYCSLTTNVTGALPVANGGTNLTSYTTGDLVYASGTGTLAKLADVATGNALISGGVGVAPSYGKIGLTTHVSGTLPVSNGGSGATTLTGYLKGNGTSAFTASATIPASDIGSGAALTKTDDTNVTLTLGGSPTTALLAATSLTLGWTGTLSVARGGTGQSSYTDGQLLIGNSTGNTLTKATLTAGTGITITNAGGSITIDNSAPLANFTAAISTTAPNDTVYAASLTATGAATNIDAVFVPKGTGAVLAQVPDGTTTGGDKRGANAVDMQTVRTTSSTRVASGAQAVVSGGSNNGASGTGATVVGGNNNTASGAYAVAGGVNATASANYTTALGGLTPTASQTYAVVVGGQANTASGQASAVVGGRGNQANASQSFVTGDYATARGVTGSRTHASSYGWNGIGTTNGTGQTGTYIVRRETTNATPAIANVTAQGASAVATIVTLPDNATYTFDILVTARRTDAADESAGYRLVGVVDRQSGAATTALVGTVTKTVIAEDNAAWDVDVYVDTTLGGFTVQVTGEAGKTIRWVAVVNTAEVTNG